MPLARSRWSASSLIVKTEDNRTRGLDESKTTCKQSVASFLSPWYSNLDNILVISLIFRTPKRLGWRIDLSVLFCELSPTSINLALAFARLFKADCLPLYPRFKAQDFPLEPKVTNVLI